MTQKEQIEALLKPGEYFEKLQLGGWIVLSNHLKPGDEIIIAWNECYYPQLFDRPVRATVNVVSAVDTVGITLQTPGARDDDGNEWPVGRCRGFMDIKWHTYKIHR